jgi:glycosyltransferase involved in cell wall biosynthesis
MQPTGHAHPVISIVAPAHRESDGVKRLYAALSEVLDGEEFELILADDGSPDDTWRWIAALADRSPNVRGIRLRRNFGKEGALASGLAAASGAAVITMDAGLQHPPRVIPAMLEQWRRGAHVVDGVKTTRTDQSAAHRFASRTFNAIFARVAGFALDEASDFKLLDRAVVDELVALPERNTFYRGLASWVWFDHVTVAFDVDEREGGDSKRSTLALARFAVDAITSFSARPLQVASGMGALAVVLGVILGAHTLVQHSRGEAVEGFTTVILLQLVLGGLILLGQGIQGAYIARLQQEVKRRPRWVVRENVGPSAVARTGPPPDDLDL